MRLSRAAALTILHLAAEKKCEIRDCNQQVTHLSDFLHDDPDDTDLCLAVWWTCSRLSDSALERFVMASLDLGADPTVAAAINITAKQVANTCFDRLPPLLNAALNPVHNHLATHHAHSSHADTSIHSAITHIAAGLQQQQQLLHQLQQQLAASITPAKTTYAATLQNPTELINEIKTAVKASTRDAMHEPIRSCSIVVRGVPSNVNDARLGTYLRGDPFLGKLGVAQSVVIKTARRLGGPTAPVLVEFHRKEDKLQVQKARRNLHDTQLSIDDYYTPEQLEARAAALNRPEVHEARAAKQANPQLRCSIYARLFNGVFIVRINGQDLPPMTATPMDTAVPAPQPPARPPPSPPSPPASTVTCSPARVGIRRGNFSSGMAARLGRPPNKFVRFAPEPEPALRTLLSYQ
eukprot:jgi/Mesvir1/26097/Mv06816-RA.1